MSKKEQLEKRKELLLKRKELLERKAQLEAPREAHSVATTARAHLGEGLSLGFSDNISGAVNKALDKGMRATNKLGLTGPSPYQVDEELEVKGFTGDLSGDSYVEARDEQRKLLEETAEDNPGTAFVTDMMGSGVTSAAAALATGGTSLAGEGAVLGIGYGDSDDMSGISQDALVGGLLGKYGGKALSKAGGAGKSMVKKVTPKMSNMIYNSIKRKAGGKQPGKVKEAIGKLESKYGIFTNVKGMITPEKAQNSLNNLSSKINSKLSLLTKEMSENVNSKKLKEMVDPLIQNMQSMHEKTLKNTTDVELQNKLGKSTQLLREIAESGDYERLVNVMNSEIKERYVRYNAFGEAQVPKAIRGEMKNFLKKFDKGNTKLITETLGEESGKMFKNGMEDLSSYHKVVDFVGKNVGQDMPSLSPRIYDFVTSGFLGYMTNPVVAAGYMAGTMALRSPVVQSFMAKSYKQIPRGFEGARGLLNSPIKELVRENLSEEVQHLVQKMDAGVVLPKMQQHLVVKNLTSVFPEFFEHSEFESEVDGKLTDPYEISMEKDRIMQDDSISNMDKFRQINSLNKDGTLIRKSSTAKGTVKPMDEATKTELGGFLKKGMELHSGSN